MINTDRLVDTFLELVRIDSPSGQEETIGKYLAQRLQGLGLTTGRDELGNLIGRLEEGTGETLLLSAHMDTVGTDTGIEPVIRDGVIYSSGDTILGGDDKSGVAAILEVLTLLKEKGLAHPPLEVVFSVGEELGLYGARNLDTKILSAKQGLIMDSGGPTGHIVVCAPGQDSLVFTVHGVTAHAGAEPEKGINAIRVASEAIAAMPMGRIDTETTCNIGIISGGTARNIVPASTRVVGEARSRDPKKLKALTEEIVLSFQQAAENHDASVEMEITRAYDAYRVPENTPIVQIVSQAARELGHEVMLSDSGGGTDGNIYNAAGIQCIVLSTGMKEVHTANEHIAIADMAAGTALLLEAVTRLAS
ncbi:MAG: M20/M25/M40 family metallo-hydrolase [Chloroflexota bacterium]|nr:M20/M25/M40 family metallo-hydrolase [Chloroflexota bacterium]